MTNNLLFNKAEFLLSAPSIKQAPDDTGKEVAFAGRSNAGKSSAINTLTNNKKLARTSKTPGRTQLLNFFSLSEDCRLVDLPGYGFAKVPKAIKQAWDRNLAVYLQERQSLKGLVMLMDIRHPLKPIDLEMIEAFSSSWEHYPIINKIRQIKNRARQKYPTKSKARARERELGR